MFVIKRDGTSQEVSFDKIQVRISYLCGYKNSTYSLLPYIKVQEVTQAVIAKLHDKITTAELDEEAVRIAQNKAFEHPEYGILATRIAISNFHKNTIIAICRHYNIHKLTAQEHLYKYVSELLYLNTHNGQSAPLINQQLYKFIMENSEWLESIIDYKLDYTYDYLGFKILEDKYLLRPLVSNVRTCIERPQHMIMRIALCIVNPVTVTDANILTDALKSKIVEIYTAMSNKFYTHATPTLFNAGSPKPQLASCFLLALPDDSIEGIMDANKQCAIISKNAGGIGIHWHNIRSKGAYIKGTGGTSNGPIPFLKVLNELSLAVDQGGNKRPGSIAVYFEPWHADIMEILDLKRKEGNEHERARELFYGLWIPDAFMRAVENNEDWYLMCPNQSPHLSDVYGKEFDELYDKYVAEKKYVKKIPARDVFRKIIDCQTETGLPYTLFKDACNRKSNQRHYGTIKSSNLCVTGDTQILTDKGYYPIQDLVNTKIRVWNGEEFSKTVVMKTGSNQRTLTIKFSDGSDLKCTEYHKFILPDGTVVPANELCVGQTLKSFKFPIQMPVVIDLDFKPPDLECVNMNGKFVGSELVKDTNFVKNMPAGFIPNLKIPINESLIVKINWMRGLLDYCGHINIYNDNQLELQIHGNNKFILFDIKLLLQTLGVNVNMSFINFIKMYQLILTPGGTIRLLRILNLTSQYLLEHLPSNRISHTSAQCIQTTLNITDIISNGSLHDTYCFNEPKLHQGIFNSVLTGNCTEIIEYSDDQETSVCTLASICLPKFVVNNTFNYTKLREIVKLVTWSLNQVIDVMYYPNDQTKLSNQRHRPIGIGVQGLADVYAMLKIPFDSEDARRVNFLIFENIYYAALEESCNAAEQFGPYETYAGSPVSEGKLQFDLWLEDGHLLPFELSLNWPALRGKILCHGVRNSLLVAPMPTASTSDIMGFNPCFEPYQSIIYLRENQSGEFVIINKHLVSTLLEKNQWTRKIRNWIISKNGFLRDVVTDPDAPSDVKEALEPIADIYKTAFEIDPGVIIQQAHDRGFFIDQSQSMNLFFKQVTPKNISSALFKGWKLGLKTGSYYIRSRPAQDAIKFTLSGCDMCSA
jgi:ribonucleoside-diphosphate reductase alpha chain